MSSQLDSATGHEPADVLLCGTLFFDVVLTGLRQPPRPGTEVFSTGLGSGPGGIATFAAALSRLGLRTSVCAAFGDDAPGDICWRALAERGVDLSPSMRFTGWTTPVTVSLGYDDDRALVTHQLPVPDGLEPLAATAPPTRAVVAHLQFEPAARLARARSPRSLVFADVGWDPSGCWSTALTEQLTGCHAFMPNAQEAMSYTRTDTPDAALARLGDLVPLAVITCGARGAIGVDGTTGEHASVAGLAVDVMDPTGAGDVFGSALVLGTLAGWPLVQRLRFANLAAALSVQHPGGAPAAPGWPDLAAWWRDQQRAERTELRARYAFLEQVLDRAGAPRSAQVIGHDHTDV